MQKDSKILNKLISGKLNKDELSKFADNSELMTKNNIHTFDTNAAWEKTKQKINVKRKSKNLIKISKFAASALLLIGLSFLGTFIFNSEKNFKVYSENNVKELTLPDGSVITLNKNSEITYPNKFNQKNRSVSFSGEAFFNIQKNPEKPFIIYTNNAQIKVLGTSFNVNTKQKEVIVKSGTVEFKSNKNSSKKVILTKGEKGFIVSGNFKKLKNNNQNYLAWKTHFFNYENEKLSNIVKDINRVYNVEIVLQNPEIGEMTVGKTTFDNNSIEEIIDIICNTLPLKSIKKDDKIILENKR